MDKEIGMDHTAPAEKIFAEIPYLGRQEEADGYAEFRVDPLSYTIDLATEEVKVAMRNYLHSRNRIMQLEDELRGLQRKVLNMELGILRAGEGAALIAKERARQQVEEGYGDSNDDRHTAGQLADAAVAYVDNTMHRWPWSSRPDFSGGRVRQLEKAGALIAAEIDRLERERRSGEEVSPDFDAPYHRSVKDNPQA